MSDIKEKKKIDEQIKKEEIELHELIMKKMNELSEKEIKMIHSVLFTKRLKQLILSIKL